MRDQPDHEHLRPLGEGGHCPDEAGDQQTRQQLQTDDRQFQRRPDSMIGTTSSCRSCGADITTGGTKCEFCAEHGISPDDPEAADAGADLLGVAYALVEAQSATTAQPLGAAAQSLLAKNPGTSVDDYQLIADVDEVAPTLINQWGELPPVARTDSDAGEWLLEAALIAIEADQDLTAATADATLLVDESGTLLESARGVARCRGQATDPLWLVPALVLQDDRDTKKTEDGGHPAARRESLFCRDCESERLHTRQRQRSTSAPSAPGGTVWECDVCDAVRYGPES